jgi:uncharacterized protein
MLSQVRLVVHFPRGMNGRLILRICVLADFALAMIGSAQDFANLRPQGYLSDFAEVVDAATRERIERFCAQVDAQTGAQIAVVTLDTLHGKPIEEVALTLFRSWGVGRKGENDGVILLIAVRERRSRITVGYGLEPVFPTAVAAEILQGMRSELQARKYGEALLRGARQIGRLIARARNAELNEAIPPPVRSLKLQGPLRTVRLVVLGVVVPVLVLFALGKIFYSIFRTTPGREPSSR